MQLNSLGNYNLSSINSISTSMTCPKGNNSLFGNLKSNLEADTFNGKTLQSANNKKANSVLTDLVEFLGRKNSSSSKKFKKRMKKEVSDHQTRKNNHKKEPVENKKDDVYVRPTYEYKNMFDENARDNLISVINPDFKSYLRTNKSVHDVNKAYTRITSLSTYLKEKMVGFITPDGDHWFEKAMPFILKGAVAKDIPEENYEKVAMAFWGLLAHADNYWKSDEFLSYLQNNMKQTQAVRAVIKAVETLQEQGTHLDKTAFTGYPSKIKYIEELYEAGAYSGKTLKWDSDPKHSPSAEHIFPHSLGGDDVNVDYNYLIVAAQPNSDRGSIPLLDYLKGWDAEDSRPRRRRFKELLA